MDANKLKTAKKIGLKVVNTCGTCSYSVFRGAAWGSCTKHSYTHGKHQSERQMPAHLAMVCDDWIPRKTDPLQLGTYTFLNELVKNG